MPNTITSSKDQDAVVAITSGVQDMQAVLNVIWDKLLPAMQPQPLPPDAAACQQLKDKLARLEVCPAQGTASSPLAGQALNRKFVFPANTQKIESLALWSSDSGKILTFTARMDGKDMKAPCGFHQWKKGRAPFSGPLAQFPDESTAGTFAWSAEDACVIKLCAFETPYHTTLTLKFEGDQVRMNSEVNVAFGPTKRPELIGRAE